jgi:NAD(P)-dependent dehydrogenase (short-subunit alcohol dehydrogenase family)
VGNVPESNLNGRRLVVGASRGIGLALAEAQLAEPGVTQVVATHRPESDARELQRLADLHGDRLRRVPLDVSDTTSLAAFEQLVATIDGGFDLVIHAAGILHEENIQPEKSLAECNATALARLFEVNSIGPLMVAAALLPHQGRGRRFTFAALSAMVGSISDNRLGGWYGYRASKAALNQFLKTLAVECRQRPARQTLLRRCHGAAHPGRRGLRRPGHERAVPQLGRQRNLLVAALPVTATRGRCRTASSD